MTTEVPAAGEHGSNTGGAGRSAGGTRVADALDTARTRASEAYAAARERTSAAYGSVREGASRATQRTSETVEAYPEAALIGGLAIGALLAAVLPRTQREAELVGEVGRRLNQTAQEAARAAKEAARGKLDEVGLSRDAARQKLGDITSGAAEVARTSATAAVQAVKGGGAE